MTHIEVMLLSILIINFVRTLDSINLNKIIRAEYNNQKEWDKVEPNATIMENLQEPPEQYFYIRKLGTNSYIRVGTGKGGYYPKDWQEGYFNSRMFRKAEAMEIVGEGESDLEMVLVLDLLYPPRIFNA